MSGTQKSTTPRDQKLLLRHLIKDISVRAIDVPRTTLRTRILWHTGAVTELDIDRIGKGGWREPVRYEMRGTGIAQLPSQDRA